ncbi:hypothetical protein DL96DRAFT_1617490 [Flagelloscypha sp. PMI_526]|nr:hypothetical protein DL96DRAFT_1617490 [Flagelloscypha sp. PMI_526]
MTTFTVPHLPICPVEDRVLLGGLSLRDSSLRKTTRAIHAEAESQIKQLEGSIALLQAHIAARKHLMELCVQGLSTINQLPDELLTLILQTTIDHIREENRHTYFINNSALLAQIRLGHVSNKWKHLLHGTATLWQNLELFIPLVRFQSTYPLITLWMERSAQLPLLLKVAIGKDRGTTEVPHESIYDPDFEPICMLAKHSARWKRLALWIGVDKLPNYPCFRRRYECPILESFNTSRLPRIPAFLHHAPALNTVSFKWKIFLPGADNLKNFCREVAVHIPSLRHITWEYSSRDRTVQNQERRIAEAVYCLANLPNLETLNVTLLPRDPAPSSIPNLVFPKLKTLILSGDASLLQLVNLPGLETLQLGPPKVRTGLELLPEFWHRAPNLRNVAIRSPERLDWFKLGMISSPSITCLSLQLTWSQFSYITEIFTALLATTTASMIPRLEWLGLHMNYFPSFEAYRADDEDGPERIGWPLGGAVGFVAAYSGHLQSSTALPVLKKVVVKVSTTHERKMILREALLDTDNVVLPQRLVIDVWDNAPPFK